MAANTVFAKALHIMAALAYYEGKLLNSEWLARSIGTNPVVVRNLVRHLHSHGLVKTYVGKKGGITLGKEPSQITLLHIYQSIDHKTLFSIPDVSSEAEEQFSFSIHTVMNDVFNENDETVQGILAKKTVSDLAFKISKVS